MPETVPVAPAAPPVPPAGPRLQMRGIQKRFGPTLALSNVYLDVMPGEVHALIGENGAGKSTLMKVLSGAERPDAGEMRLDGQPYEPRDPHDARQRGVVMIYQELTLAPHLTVAENVLLGVEPSRFGFVNRKELYKKTEAALEWMDHPEVKPQTLVRDLPLSARQMVEIARALALRCGTLVLDEPTSSLGRTDVERLFNLIRRLRGEGLAVVYISHFLEEVLGLCDSYTVLRDGASIGTGALAETNAEQLIQMMVGRKVTDLYPRTIRRPTEVILEINALAGMEKPVSASLEVRRGEVLGIAGLVGAGRSEFLRAIFGLDPVRSGQVKIGVHVGHGSPADRWERGVGLLSEDRKAEGLALGMSIADNMTLSKLDGLGPLGFILPGRQAEAAQKWSEALRVRCRNVRQRVGDLSGGNQQKVALGRLLHHNVDVLLLDEPTRGIDVGSKAQIYSWLDQIAGEHRAVILVSSYIPELLGVCDRIAVMCRGQLGPARGVTGLTAQALLREATGGG